MAHDRPGHVVVGRGRQRPAGEFVERAGLARRGAHRRDLPVQPGAEHPDHQGDRKEEGKRQHVAALGHGEGEPRLGEKEIVGGKREQAGQHRGPHPPEARGREHRAEEHEAEIGERQDLVHAPGDGHGERGKERAQGVGTQMPGFQHRGTAAAGGIAAVIGGDHRHLEPGPEGDERAVQRGRERPARGPPAPRDHDPGHVARPGEIEDRVRRTPRGHQGLGFRPQGLGERERLVRRGLGLAPGAVDQVQHDPGRAAALGHPLGRAHQPLGRGGPLQAHQDPVPGRPGAAHGMGAHVIEHLAVHPLGRGAQRHLAQCGQVAAAEEPGDRALRLVGHVDLARPQPLLEVLGRKIDHLDLVRLLQHRVGHGLAHLHARDALHDVVEAFEVLDVQRRVHVDARGQQFLDILPALGVAAALDIGMGEFVHQGAARPPGEDGVEVHLRQAPAAIGDDLAGHGLEPDQQALGLAPPMGLDHADRHVEPVALCDPGGAQHGEGLAHAGRGAEEDLQPPAPRPLDLGQQAFGIRAALGVSHSARGGRRRARDWRAARSPRAHPASPIPRSRHRGSPARPRAPRRGCGRCGRPEAGRMPG